MHANCPMHKCGNTVRCPVVLWQHVQELLDPFMTQPEVKALHGGRWAHTRVPLNTHRGKPKNRDSEHTALLRETRNHARTVTTNVFNLYAWMQLPTNPKKSPDHRKHFSLVGSFAFRLTFTKKGARQCEGGGMCRLPGPAAEPGARSPKTALHGQLTHLVRCLGGNITTRADG